MLAAGAATVAGVLTLKKRRSADADTTSPTADTLADSNSAEPRRSKKYPATA